METSKITNEVFINTKKRIVPKKILTIFLSVIVALTYTAFVIHCLYTDLTFKATDNLNGSFIFYGIAFYVIYLIMMFVIIKSIYKSVKALHQFHMNDYNAVNLVTDDFQDELSSKSATVANAIVNSNSARVFLDTF